MVSTEMTSSVESSIFRTSWTRSCRPCPCGSGVFTVPHRLRYRLAFDHALCHAVLGVSVRAVLGWYRRRARRAGVPRVAPTRRSQPASQDFTPRPPIQAIVDGIAPQPGEVIVDPPAAPARFRWYDGGR
jgi:hypothetical protein